MAAIRPSCASASSPIITFLACDYPVDDFILAVRRREEPQGEASNAVAERVKRKTAKKAQTAQAGKNLSGGPSQRQLGLVQAAGAGGLPDLLRAAKRAAAPGRLRARLSPPEGRREFRRDAAGLVRPMGRLRLVLPRGINVDSADASQRTMSEFNQPSRCRRRLSLRPARLGRQSSPVTAALCSCALSGAFN